MQFPNLFQPSFLWLFRNGEKVQMKGYCTDIYFEEGIKWKEKVKTRLQGPVNASWKQEIKRFEKKLS